MSAAFVIEIDGDPAGLALPERRGFRFYASARAYWELEGRWFRNLTQTQRAAAEVRRRREAAALRARPEQRRDDFLDLRSESARGAPPLPDGAWGSLLERYLRRDDRGEIAA